MFSLLKSNIVPMVLMSIRGSSLVIKFVFTLFVAKFLGFESLGLYGLAASLTILVRTFAGLSLMHTISRKAVTRSKDFVIESLGYYLFVTILVYIIFLPIGFLSGVYLNNVSLILLISFVVFCEHLSSDFYTLLLNLSKPLVANILHFIRSALWMTVYMLSAWLNPSLCTVEWLLSFWLVGGFISTVASLYAIKFWYKFTTIKIKGFRAWIMNEFKDARAMYGTTCVTSINQQFSYYLIAMLLGLELTGVYVYFMQLLGALSNLIQTGIVQVSRPRLIKAYKDDLSIFIDAYKTCLLKTIVTTLIISAIAGPLYYYITLLMKKDLAIEWIWLIVPVLIVLLISMINEVNKLVYYSQFKDHIILKLSLVSLMTGSFLTVILIISYGLVGAFITAVVNSIIMLLINYIVIKKMLFLESSN